MATKFGTDQQMHLHEAAMVTLRNKKYAENRSIIAKAERDNEGAVRWKEIAVDMQNQYAEQMRQLIEPVMNRIENELHPM